MPLTVFYTSVTCSREIKKEQERLFSILDSKKILYIKVDISQNTECKELMRKIAGDDKALPPQICNGDVHCGTYEKFHDAVECDEIEKFLKLKR